MKAYSATAFCSVRPDNLEIGIIVATPELACAAVSGTFTTNYALSNVFYSYNVNVTANYEAFYGRGACTGILTNQFGEAKNIEIYPDCICQTGLDLSSFSNFFRMRFSDFREGKCATSLLTLTPAPNQKDPRPKGTEGKDPKSSTLELIAKVMEGSTPKAGVVVGFGVGVEAQTGGHAHGDLGSIPRPKGKLSKTSGETDSNGEIKLTFIADEPAGLHAVVADCTPAGCANKATHIVKVKVPDLIHIPPDYGNAPARYVLIGNYIPSPAPVPLPKINHNNTHYLTEESWGNLKTLMSTFIDLGWGQVGINDASLEWGGMFDIDGKWLEGVLRPNGKFTTGGHAEHRDGQQVDISFVRPASVSVALRQQVWDDVCKAKGAGLPRILWHQNDGYAPHYHIYLTGKGVTGAPKQCGKQ